MEYWSNEKKQGHGSIIPLIQRSITPLLRKLKISNVVAAMALMILITTSPMAATACPGCNFAMDNAVGRGFNMSILFMMAMPFFVVGSMVVGLFIYRRSQYNHTINSHETSNANQTEEKEP